MGVGKMRSEQLLRQGDNGEMSAIGTCSSNFQLPLTCAALQALPRGHSSVRGMNRRLVLDAESLEGSTRVKFCSGTQPHPDLRPRELHTLTPEGPG